MSVVSKTVILQLPFKFHLVSVKAVIIVNAFIQ